jgi:hypothetical protein
MAKSLRQKDINFLAVLEGSNTRTRRGIVAFAAPGALALLMLVGIVTFICIQVNIAQLEGQTNEIKTYLNSTPVTRQLADANDLKIQAAAMQSRADAIATPLINLAGYPDLVSEDYARIRDMADVNIELTALTFDRTTGLLTLQATSDHVLAIPTFIGQMRSSGLFSDVSYSGYVDSAGSVLSSATVRGNTGLTEATEAGADDSELLAPRYSFSVVCAVKPIDRTAAPATGESTDAEAAEAAEAATGGQ